MMTASELLKRLEEIYATQSWPLFLVLMEELKREEDGSTKDTPR
jgi:hypothetical protein